MPEQSSIPDDVVWARGVRFHLQAVYASAGIVALLTFLGVAAVLMAGPLASDPPVTAGILALLIGGVCAIVGAVAAGVGQLRVLGAVRNSDLPPMEAVESILERTRNTFSMLPRLALAGCVALIASYLIWLPAGFWGTVVGTFVVIQVALVLDLVRRSVLASTRLHRRS